jgi:hypothetical protein
MTDTDWEHMVTGMASVAFPFPRNGEFLKALSRNSKDLMAISEDFRPLAKEYSIVNYWEEDIILGFGDVVSPSTFS